MGRDSGTDTDGSATLLPWRDVDGAVALEADAGAVDVMSDDDAGHMLPQRDAGVLVPPADAGGPQPDAGVPHHGTCESCVADADCFTGYACRYRSLDGAKACFSTGPKIGATPLSCTALPGASYLAVDTDALSSSTNPWGLCTPRTPDDKLMTCAAWHTATGL